MPGLRDLLDRFRPAGAPGAAGAAGVPVERRVGLEAELAPVFDAVSDVERECANLRQRGADEADRCRAAAAEQADARVARARANATAERAAAAAVISRRAEQDVSMITADAGRAAQALRRHAATRLDELVARAVQQAIDDIAAYCMPEPEIPEEPKQETRR